MVPVAFMHLHIIIQHFCEKEHFKERKTNVVTKNKPMNTITLAL